MEEEVTGCLARCDLKFIIHPNYKIKISRELVAKVNFITATRRIDKKEFNGKRYVKIGNDPITE